MKLQRTPIALAAFSLCAGISLGAQAAPSVSFKQPTSGKTISGSISGSACEVTGSNIYRVRFFLDSTQLNTDYSSRWNCSLDTRKFSNGTHTLKAVAYDRSGTTRSTQVSVNIQNGTTNTAPSVSFVEPASGASVSGTSVACSADASDSNGIREVRFFLDSTQIASDSGSPYACTFDSTKFSNGTHTLKAVAYDTLGATRTTTRSITINNGTASNTPPVVAFSKPANNSTVAPGTSVACTVTATDSDGVKQLQWFLDGRLLNTESSAPYDTCKVNTTGLSGAHVIKAVATDNKGAIGEAQVTINVGSTTPPPVVTNPAPVVAFTKPANNATVAPGTSVACEVTATDSDGVKQVQWFLDGKLLNTEGLAPYDVCKVNTTGLSGAHVIKAVATDNKGAIGEAQVTINVGSTTNVEPSVGLTAPQVGATLSGTAAAYAATASDDDGSIAKVDFYLVQGTSQTLIGTDSTNSYGGTFDTTKVPNGEYTLMAVATDNAGASATSQRNVMISNVAPNPTPTPDPDPTPGTGTTLPSTDARAVPTFESIGLYWKPGSNPGTAGCTVRYRKASESTWKEGLAMWYAPTDSECRGSIVHLEPGTDYAVEMGVGTEFKAGLNTKTWSENFPIAKTIQVAGGSAPLEITEGGSPSGYVLYTGPATIDVANAADYNIKISAPYVIVRGLTLKNARQDGILLTQGAKDVVIEDNDISGWGRPHPTGKVSSDGWKIGENGDSGIAARCGSGSTPWLERTIIQRNKIHHPRYGSNSWSDGHPYGPNATLFKNCGGNHVFRYNEVYSETGKYFMDAYGGGTNFSFAGMPNADSDVYGNILMHAWDDAIEAEGANMNVRVWGNYFDQTATAVATTSTSKGPIYIWRNVQNRSRNKSMATLDGDSRLYSFKSGSADGYGDGRRYVFHNTSLQAAPPAGSTYPLGAGAGLAGPGNGQNLTNTVSRNNIFHIWKSHWNAIYNVGTGNDLDYDMTNGNVQAYAGAEANRVIGSPIFQAGHGWQSESRGMYQLAPNSPGFDRAARIPNFNDGFTGAGPDMGAHEAGTAAMRLGVGGTGLSVALPATGGTTTGGTTTDATAGSTDTSGSVCSSALCVITQ